MQPLSKSEREKILSRIYWDVDVNVHEMAEKLSELSAGPADLRTISFFRRLLTSCDWYTLLKLIPADKIVDVLTDAVIGGIYPKELQTKFQYARSILSKKNLPFSR